MAVRKRAARKRRRASSKKQGQKIVIRAKGKKPVVMKKGALHRALGVPEGKPIPKAKREAALAGRYGPAVKRMAVAAYKGILKKGRETAAKHRRKKQ